MLNFRVGHEEQSLPIWIGNCTFDTYLRVVSVAQSPFDHDELSRKNRPSGILSGARSLSVVDCCPMDNRADHFTDAISEFSLA